MPARPRTPLLLTGAIVIAIAASSIGGRLHTWHGTQRLALGLTNGSLFGEILSVPTWTPADRALPQFPHGRWFAAIPAARAEDVARFHTMPVARSSRHVWYVSLWPPLAFAVFLNLLALRRWAISRPERGRCPKCGFDVSAVHVAVCPECGRDVPVHSRPRTPLQAAA